MFVCRPGRAGADSAGSGHGPTILYGYGGFGLPLTPGVLRHDPRLGRGRRRLRRRQPARRRRGGRGAGTATACSATSRTSSTTSTPPPSGWSPTAGRRRSSSPSAAARNGGLLVGAALTQRPDLFAAVVCSAPLLDMVRYEQFGLGATWNVEYGSAADAGRARLAARRTRRTTTWPTAPTTRRTLFTVFDGDTRVDPLHARKMCAALQHATTGDAPDPDPRRGRRRARRAGAVPRRSTCRSRCWRSPPRTPVWPARLVSRRALRRASAPDPVAVGMPDGRRPHGRQVVLACR